MVGLDVVAGKVPEFDEALAQRVERAMAEHDTDGSANASNLALEIESVSRTLLRFAEAVVSATEDLHHADSFLRGLDLQMISRDHDWRAIFTELADKDLSYDAHKRVLVTRYLQYLSNRRDLLEALALERKGLETTVPVDRRALLVAKRDGAARSLSLGVGDSAMLPVDGSSRVISFGPNRYELELRTPPVLVDTQSGHTATLRAGRNLLGRHPESDLRVDQAYRNISRVHAILDWRGEDLAVTNLSKQGTNIHSNG